MRIMKQTVVYKWCTHYENEHVKASSLTGDLKQQTAWDRKKKEEMRL